MKAMRFHQYGDEGVLRYEDVDDPTPGPGEVRVRVAATSFNGVDAGIRGGYLQGPFPVRLPHTPGADVSGSVDALGDGVSGWAVGDAVVGFLPLTAPGAAAELVLAPAEVLAAAPTSVPLADAAALPLVGLTAYQALHDHAHLQAGQRVLVNGAGGAVGDYVVQLAKVAGAHVIATTSPRSRGRVESAGADEVVDHTATPAAQAVTEPVDVVVNVAPAGPDGLAELLGLVVPGGVLVNSVVVSPAPSDDERGVRGIDLYVRSDAEQLARLVGLVDEGRLRIAVADRVPLEDLPRVHADSDAGRISGKVVVLAPTT